MKTMLLSDFILLRKMLWQQVLLCFIVALGLYIGMSSPYSTVPAVAFTGGFMVTMNLIALDEINGWEKYRLTFPLSRNQLVLGRYLSILVLILCFTLAGIIVFFIFISAIPVLNGFFALDPTLLANAQNISWQTFGTTVLLSPASLLFSAAILLPFGMRFGLTKAFRLVPIVVFWILILAIVGLKALFPTLPPFANDLIIWAISPEGTLIIVLLTVALAAICYAASYFITTKAYRNREF